MVEFEVEEFLVVCEWCWGAGWRRRDGVFVEVVGRCS